MKRRRIFGAIVLVAVAIGGVFVFRLGVRTALAGALLDLRRHEKLDAHYDGVGFGVGSLPGFGVAGLTIEDADGSALASIDAAALHPGVVGVDGHRRPGLILDVRGARIDATALRRWQTSLPSKKRPPFETVRRALRTLRRNFGSSPWELRLEDVDVGTECGDLRLSHLRVAGRSPSSVSLRLDTTGEYVWKHGDDAETGRAHGQMALYVYRDAVVLDGALSGSDPLGEPGPALTGRLPAPAWADALPARLDTRDDDGTTVSWLDVRSRLCESPRG